MTDTGRSGKVRLEQRLITARRGAALLDRKQHIMTDELDRLQLHADGIRHEWEDRARDAAVWLRRAAALDGRERIEAAAPVEPAVVEIHWGGAMGVTYPEDADCRLPDATEHGGSSALSYARIAHRSALAAAVQHAAVQRAVLLLSTELTATRTRQRAVENRWIPRLEERLSAIQRKLEDQELEEGLRVRWAADRQTSPGSQATRPRTSERKES
ncbi:V-type ATP synthase subunit D [Cryobacterium sp. PH31-AA6]|uniref:V-type ATP synthase subunit D n=1 Tax=Cryobacterium sp. PH31-AA6 TaxID=3046205 RepID=UPI0024BADBA2|nr:V-type ATP synthase subunit D [Cryobacterium sp. PH31-AA6]MDJ0322698.1 V-type ATP synthase subunit D [Cryobacterium sp. PH31-AA6]